VNPIVFPLQPGMQCAAVANLQDALLLLIEHQVIKTFTRRNRPTVSELQTLVKGLKQEREHEKFGDATRQLVQYFQSQQKLGDRLAGVVEAKTAAALNKLLTDLPAAASGALLSEHTTLTGAIAVHYTGQLKELQESGERSDITYLANKTGWDARTVALAVLADQFSAGIVTPSASAPAIAPEFFYALFRAGLPPNEDMLYRAGASTLTNIWNQAADEGVAPSSIKSSDPAVVQRLQDC
jgi:hypothetical protein